MTAIELFNESYLLHPRIIFRELTKDGFKLRTLTELPSEHQVMGFFDPTWSGYEESYRPGMFVNAVGETEYDDTKYAGQQAYILSFKHLSLGNFPMLRGIGWGHYHTQYIVSTNSIRPQDVMQRLPNGDIMFNANLSRFPPVHVTQADGSEDILLEIIPHLTHEEEGKLATDALFTLEIKKKLIEVTKQKDTQFAELTLKRIEATSALAVSTMLQVKVNDYYQETRIALDKVLQLGLEIHTERITGLEVIEKQYNFAGLGLKGYYEDITRSATLLQDNMRVLAATAQQSLTDTQKFMLASQATNIVGIDYMRKFILGAEQHVIQLPVGSQKLTMSRASTPTELFILQAQQFATGKTTPEQFSRAMEDYKRHQDDVIKTAPSINAASEQLSTELLAKSRGEQYARAEQSAT